MSDTLLKCKHCINYTFRNAQQRKQHMITKHGSGRKLSSKQPYTDNDVKAAQLHKHLDTVQQVDEGSADVSSTTDDDVLTRITCSVESLQDDDVSANSTSGSEMQACFSAVSIRSSSRLKSRRSVDGIPLTSSKTCTGGKENDVHSPASSRRSTRLKVASMVTVSGNVESRTIPVADTSGLQDSYPLRSCRMKSQGSSPGELAIDEVYSESRRTKACDVDNVSSSTQLVSSGGAMTGSVDGTHTKSKSRYDIVKKMKANSNDLYKSYYKFVAEKRTEKYQPSRDGEIGSFACNFCEHYSENIDRARSHHRIHTGVRPFHCLLCKYKAKQPTRIKTHILTIHRGELSEEQSPARTTKDNVSRRKTIKLSGTSSNSRNIDHSISRASTTNCKMLPKSKGIVYYNFKFVAEKPEQQYHPCKDEATGHYKCAYCEYTSGQLSKLKAHHRQHTGSKPYHCLLCVHQSKSLDHIKVHIQGKHQDTWSKSQPPASDARQRVSVKKIAANDTNRASGSRSNTENLPGDRKTHCKDTSNGDYILTFKTNTITGTNKSSTTYKFRQCQRNVSGHVRKPSTLQRRYVCCHCSYTAINSWVMKNHLMTQHKIRKPRLVADDVSESRNYGNKKLPVLDVINKTWETMNIQRRVTRVRTLPCKSQDDSNNTDDTKTSRKKHEGEKPSRVKGSKMRDGVWQKNVPDTTNDTTNGISEHSYQRMVKSLRCGRYGRRGISFCAVDAEENMERDIQMSGSLQCPQCGKCFDNVERTLEHLREHTGYQPYVCDFCGFTTGRGSDVSNHISQQKIDREKLKQLYTFKVGKLERTTTIKMVAISNSFKCPCCPRMFDMLQNAKQHYRTHTNEKPYHCNLCSYKAVNQSPMSDHIKVHHKKCVIICPTRRYQEKIIEYCLLSEKDVTGRNGRKRKKRSTRYGQIMSDFTDSTGESQDESLNSAAETDPSSRRVQCSITTNYTAYLPDKWYVVLTGSVERSLLPKVKRDAKKHQGQFCCPFCCRLFDELIAAMIHIRLHTGECPYHCIACKYATAFEDKILLHSKLHEEYGVVLPRHLSGDMYDAGKWLSEAERQQYECTSDKDDDMPANCIEEHSVYVNGDGEKARSEEDIFSVCYRQDTVAAEFDRKNTIADECDQVDTMTYKSDKQDIIVEGCDTNDARSAACIKEDICSLKYDVDTIAEVCDRKDTMVEKCAIEDAKVVDLETDDAMLAEGDVEDTTTTEFDREDTMVVDCDKNDAKSAKDTFSVECKWKGNMDVVSFKDIKATGCDREDMVMAVCDKDTISAELNSNNNKDSVCNKEDTMATVGDNADTIEEAVCEKKDTRDVVCVKKDAVTAVCDREDTNKAAVCDMEDTIAAVCDTEDTIAAVCDTEDMTTDCNEHDTIVVDCDHKDAKSEEIEREDDMTAECDEVVYIPTEPDNKNMSCSKGAPSEKCESDNRVARCVNMDTTNPECDRGKAVSAGCNGENTMNAESYNKDSNSDAVCAEADKKNAKSTKLDQDDMTTEWDSEATLSADDEEDTFTKSDNQITMTDKVITVATHNHDSVIEDGVTHKATEINKLTQSNEECSVTHKATEINKLTQSNEECSVTHKATEINKLTQSNEECSVTHKATEIIKLRQSNKECRGIYDAQLELSLKMHNSMCKNVLPRRGDDEVDEQHSSRQMSGIEGVEDNESYAQQSIPTEVDVNRATLVIQSRIRGFLARRRGKKTQSRLRSKGVWKQHRMKKFAALRHFRQANMQNGKKYPMKSLVRPGCSTLLAKKSNNGCLIQSAVTPVTEELCYAMNAIPDKESNHELQVNPEQGDHMNALLSESALQSGKAFDNLRGLIADHQAHLESTSSVKESNCELTTEVDPKQVDHQTSSLKEGALQRGQAFQHLGGVFADHQVDLESTSQIKHSEHRLKMKVDLKQRHRTTSYRKGTALPLDVQACRRVHGIIAGLVGTVAKQNTQMHVGEKSKATSCSHDASEINKVSICQYQVKATALPLDVKACQRLRGLLAGLVKKVPASKPWTIDEVQDIPVLSKDSPKQCSVQETDIKVLTKESVSLTNHVDLTSIAVTHPQLRSPKVKLPEIESENAFDALQKKSYQRTDPALSTPKVTLRQNKFELWTMRHLNIRNALTKESVIVARSIEPVPKLTPLKNATGRTNIVEPVEQHPKVSPQKIAKMSEIPGHVCMTPKKIACIVENIISPETTSHKTISTSPKKYDVKAEQSSPSPKLTPPKRFGQWPIRHNTLNVLPKETICLEDSKLALQKTALISETARHEITNESPKDTIRLEEPAKPDPRLTLEMTESTSETVNHEITNESPKNTKEPETTKADVCTAVLFPKNSKEPEPRAHTELKVSPRNEMGKVVTVVTSPKVTSPKKVSLLETMKCDTIDASPKKSNQEADPATLTPKVTLHPNTFEQLSMRHQNILNALTKESVHVAKSVESLPKLTPQKNVTGHQMSPKEMSNIEPVVQHPKVSLWEKIACIVEKSPPQENIVSPKTTSHISISTKTCDDKADHRSSPSPKVTPPKRFGQWPIRHNTLNVSPRETIHLEDSKLALEKSASTFETARHEITNESLKETIRLAEPAELDLKLTLEKSASTFETARHEITNESPKKCDKKTKPDVSAAILFPKDTKEPETRKHTELNVSPRNEMGKVVTAVTSVVQLPKVSPLKNMSEIPVSVTPKKIACIVELSPPQESIISPETSSPKTPKKCDDKADQSSPSPKATPQERFGQWPIRLNTLNVSPRETIHLEDSKLALEKTASTFETARREISNESPKPDVSAAILFPKDTKEPETRKHTEVNVSPKNEMGKVVTAVTSPKKVSLLKPLKCDIIDASPKKSNQEADPAAAPTPKVTPQKDIKQRPIQHSTVSKQSQQHPGPSHPAKKGNIKSLVSMNNLPPRTEYLPLQRPRFLSFYAEQRMLDTNPYWTQSYHHMQRLPDHMQDGLQDGRYYMQQNARHYSSDPYDDPAHHTQEFSRYRTRRHSSDGPHPGYLHEHHLASPQPSAHLDRNTALWRFHPYARNCSNIRQDHRDIFDAL